MSLYSRNWCEKYTLLRYNIVRNYYYNYNIIIITILYYYKYNILCPITGHEGPEGE